MSLLNLRMGRQMFDAIDDLRAQIHELGSEIHVPQVIVASEKPTVVINLLEALSGLCLENHGDLYAGRETLVSLRPGEEQEVEISMEPCPGRHGDEWPLSEEMLVMKMRYPGLPNLSFTLVNSSPAQLPVESGCHTVVVVVVSDQVDNLNALPAVRNARERDPTGGRTLVLVTDDARHQPHQPPEIVPWVPGHLPGTTSPAGDLWTPESMRVDLAMRHQTPASERATLVAWLTQKVHQELTFFTKSTGEALANCQRRLKRSRRRRSYLGQIGRELALLLTGSISEDPYFDGPGSRALTRKRLGVVVRLRTGAFESDLRESIGRHATWAPRAGDSLEMWDPLARDKDLPPRWWMTDSESTVFGEFSGSTRFREVFSERAAEWRKMSHAFIDDIWQAVREAVDEALTYVTDRDDYDEIHRRAVIPAMNEVEQPFRGMQATILDSCLTASSLAHNERFTGLTSRWEKGCFEEWLTHTLDCVFGTDSPTTLGDDDRQPVSRATLLRRLLTYRRPQMDRATYLRMYCQVKSELLVSQLHDLVVEQCILKKLPLTLETSILSLSHTKSAPGAAERELSHLRTIRSVLKGHGMISEVDLRPEAEAQEGEVREADDFALDSPETAQVQAATELLDDEGGDVRMVQGPEDRHVDGPPGRSEVPGTPSSVSSATSSLSSLDASIVRSPTVPRKRHRGDISDT